MNQIAAVEKGNDFDARRQDVIVKLLNLLVNRFESGIGIGALAQ